MTLLWPRRSSNRSGRINGKPWPETLKLSQPIANLLVQPHGWWTQCKGQQGIQTLGPALIVLSNDVILQSCRLISLSGLATGPRQSVSLLRFRMIVALGMLQKVSGNLVTIGRCPCFDQGEVHLVCHCRFNSVTRCNTQNAAELSAEWR